MRLKYLLNSVKYKIWSYFWYKSPIYICLNPFKIFRFWWKARKDFLKPEIVKHNLKRGDSLGSDYFYLDTDVNNKCLHINFEGCEWKSKYGDVRFEAVPYIIIVLFNKVWIWGLEAPLYEQRTPNEYNYKHYWVRDNMLYWEGILGYNILYHKNIIKTYQNNIWTRNYHVENLKDGGYHKLEIQNTIFQALTPRGKRIIKEHYDFLNKVPPPHKKHNKENEGSTENKE